MPAAPARTVFCVIGAVILAAVASSALKLWLGLTLPEPQRQSGVPSPVWSVYPLPRQTVAVDGYLLLSVWYISSALTADFTMVIVLVFSARTCTPL